MKQVLFFLTFLTIFIATFSMQTRSSIQSQADCVLLNACEQAAEDDISGHTPLFYVVATGKLHLVQHLVKFGANINVGTLRIETTPLHVAIDHGHVNIALYLIEQGADVNAQEGIAAPPEDPDYGLPGHTPLTFATKRSLVSVVESLLAHNADPNTHDNCGVTPLHAAALRADVAIVGLLLDYGADVTIKSRLSGQTAQETIEPLFSRLNHTNKIYRTAQDEDLLNRWREIMGLLRGKPYRPIQPRKKSRHK